MALIPRFEQETMEGQILKLIETRVDYQDLFTLKSSTIKEISEICRAKGLTKLIHEKLYPENFQTNDPVNVVSMPDKYVRDVISYQFESESEFILEVNQFYLKVTQVVDEAYTNYSFTKELVKECLDVLTKEESVFIKRFSIRKANEVMYKSIEAMREDFKDEFLPHRFYGDYVDWTQKYSKSQIVQNFELSNHKVNFKTMFDNGYIDELLLFRLYFEYEVYSNTHTQVTDKEVFFNWIDDSNKVLYSLFEYSLTDAGGRKLQEGQQLGDYHG